MVKQLPRKIVNTTHDLLFRTVHSRNLIYNTCWEDPRIDRELLGLDRDSRVVVLTSAGCNALDYLLDGSAAVHAVDVNPRQNALLELKLAVIRRGDYDDLFALFGRGSHPRYREVYAEVRADLPESAQRFWDRRIGYFAPTSRKGSFYYYGTSGAVAWLLTRYLYRRGREFREVMLDLLEAGSLEEQRALYARLEPNLWRRLDAWLMRQPALMYLLGVPRPQIRLIQEEYPGGLVGYISTKLKHVLTEVMIRDNYFWRVYLTGSYTEDCCPNYLRRENFETLRGAVDRVRVHTATVNDFLRAHPDLYTHFILLDHQDWLAQHRPEALEDEWRLILENSRPGSRVLMRSASRQVDFIPEVVRDAVRFFPELTDPLHLRDRVGTYGSVNLAVVR